MKKQDRARYQASIPESAIKRGVADRLQIAQNQGKGFYLRLNAGSFLMRDKEGKVVSRVQGCPAGTPDFIWITNPGSSSVTFIETKRPKGGKKSPEQIAFQEMAETQNCLYQIVTDLEQLNWLD